MIVYICPKYNVLIRKKIESKVQCWVDFRKYNKKKKIEVQCCDKK